MVDSKSPMGVVGPVYSNSDKQGQQSNMTMQQLQMPHSSASSYGLVPDVSNDLGPLDMDDPSGLFSFSIPFIDSTDNSVEPQLLELLSMVMNMQSSLVQVGTR